MSSLMRRIEKKIMQRAGYTRENWIVGKDRLGNPMLVPVKRDGEITDPDDNPIGRDWPARIPARAKPKTQPQKFAFNGADRLGRKVHALRRSKRSQKWLEERAKDRAA